MTTKWIMGEMMGGGWSVHLIMGLWLLMGQGVLAEPLQRRITEGIAEPNAYEALEHPSAFNASPYPRREAASQSIGGHPSSSSSRWQGEAGWSQPATTVDEWLTQIAQAELVEITSIQVKETAEGFTLRLETTGELATPETSVTGNAAIADIPNAVLNLSDGEEFFANDLTAGIALINVTNLPNNRVQIAITGTDAPPAIDISTGATGLTLSATPGDPTAQAPDDSILILVTGEQAGYLATEASTATRTDTPLRDVPQSIQVIPRQVIEDQQAIGLEEVLENAAGVTFLGNRDGRGLNISIRGFDNAPVLRDGFRLPNFIGDAAEPEVANLERVEVLRGPASVLFGQAEPGGVINLVTKKPLSEPYYNFQLPVANLELEIIVRFR